MKHELVKITPELALDMLAHNTHNRTLRAVRVAEIAADMTNGDWVYNGETIKIATDGTVLDGQHRLYAIIESETTQEILVVSGLPNSAQDTVDVGSRRQFADILKLRGEQNVSQLAAVIRRVHLWTEEGARRRIRFGSPSIPKMLATYARHPEIRDSAGAVYGVSRRLGAPGAMMGLVHYLFHDIDTEDAEKFFADLKEGANLGTDSPIRALRNNFTTRNQGTGRSPEEIQLALTIKAWNAYRDGSPMRLLHFRSGGASAERFPEPK